MNYHMNLMLRLFPSFLLVGSVFVFNCCKDDDEINEVPNMIIDNEEDYNGVENDDDERSDNNLSGGGESQDSNQGGKDQEGNGQFVSTWELPVQITNGRSETLYVYVNGESFSVSGKSKKSVRVKVDNSFSEAFVVVKNSRGEVVNLATDDTIERQYPKVKKGGSYSFVTEGVEACLSVHNSTSDDYYFYVDGERKATVGAGASVTIFLPIDVYKLKAVQKNGYVFWTTEKEKTVGLSLDWEYNKKLYVWDFKSNTLY